MYTNLVIFIYMYLQWAVAVWQTVCGHKYNTHFPAYCSIPSQFSFPVYYIYVECRFFLSL